MSTRVWEDGPVVMGILNNSPDSFHEKSVHHSTEAMVAEAEAMVEAGAEIIDIGAESNKPDAELISSETEQSRLEPAIEAIAQLDAAVSVDTWKADVADAAVRAGADIINDISGLDDPEMAAVAAEHNVPVVIGHSTDVLAEFGDEAEYDDVVSEVRTELGEIVDRALAAGVSEENVVVDPGINFGKDVVDSTTLIAQVDAFVETGYPVLVGHSRKLHYAEVNLEDGTSLPATVALTTAAVERGADIVRVHDVPENYEALKTGEILDKLDPSL